MHDEPYRKVNIIKYEKTVKFLTERVVRCWHRFPGEVVECSIPGDIQGQVRQGPRQPDLVLDLVVIGSPACDRGLKLDDP